MKMRGLDTENCIFFSHQKINISEYLWINY